MTHDAKRELERQLTARDGPVCWMCGRFVMWAADVETFLGYSYSTTLIHYMGKRICRRATIDHVKPKSRGGGWRLDNLKIACARCNHRRGSGDWRGHEPAIIGNINTRIGEWRAAGYPNPAQYFSAGLERTVADWIAVAMADARREANRG